MKDWFAHNVIGLPELASSSGQGVDDLMVYVHVLMLALLVGWLIYFGIVLWRFSARRNPKASYEGSTSHLPKYSELAVVLVEFFLLFAIAIPLWGKSVAAFPDAKNATQIQIVAQQFAWNVRYPGPDGKFGRQDLKLITNDNVFGVDPQDENGKDDVQVLNDFHVPVNKPVIVYLSSKDVIHSVKLVAMRVTQDAIPGMRIPFTFTPTKTGKFQIECAQLCGGGHAQMTGGMMTVESDDDYKKWLASKSGSGEPAKYE